MSYLITGPHEFDANLIYAADGLDPFFAFVAAVRQHDGFKRTTLDFDGHPVTARLNYEDSGIGSLRHEDSDLDEINEYRISWQFDDDDIGQKSGSFHIAPRTPDMVDESGDQIRNAVDIVGINVRAQGSNLEFYRYTDLFRRLCRVFGINPNYFADSKLHDYSNIQDAARYVRILRDESGPIHAVDGVISRIAAVAANDRSGYRKRVADDRDVPGFYHTATIDGDRAGELIHGHGLAKEIKHYLSRNPESFEPDHPLYHPKLEVAYQTSVHDGTVRFDQLDQLSRELDETLLNVLRWESYPITADDGDDLDPSVSRDGAARDLDDVYMSDSYFEIDVDDRRREIVPVPTPQLKNRQESMVIKHLTDGLTDADYDLLDQLVTDGGELSPDEIADGAGRHVHTIYKSIERLDDLVDHEYGSVALTSQYVAEKVAQAVQHARDSFEHAAETAANALRFATDEIESSSIVKWLRSNGIDIDDADDGRMLLRCGRIADVRSRDDLLEVLENGLIRWQHAGRNPDRFKNAKVRAQILGQTVVLQRAMPRLKGNMPGSSG